MTRALSLRVLTLDESPFSPAPLRGGDAGELDAAARRAVARGADYLRAEQRPDASWRGRWLADPMGVALAILDHPEDGRVVRRRASRLRAAQGADGGWSLRVGDPADADTTALAYAALKAAGLDASEPCLARARGWFQTAGGPVLSREVCGRIATPHADGALRGARELLPLCRAPRLGQRRRAGGRPGAGPRGGAASGPLDTLLAGHALIEASGFEPDVVAPVIEACRSAAHSHSALQAAAALRVVATLVTGEKRREWLPPRLRVRRGAPPRRADVATVQALIELGQRLAAALGSLQQWGGGFSAGTGRRGPAAADVTALAVEGLARWRAGGVCPTLRRGVAHLHRTQRACGSWAGGWAAGGVVATSWAVRALSAAGAAHDAPRIESALNWLLAMASPAGGWASPAGRRGDPAGALADDPRRSAARVTPAETAAAVSAFAAVGWRDHPAVGLAVGRLVESQDGLGDWPQTRFALRGSGGRFRHNNLYPASWAVEGLAAWLSAEGGAAPAVCLRLAAPDTVGG